MILIKQEGLTQKAEERPVGVIAFHTVFGRLLEEIGGNGIQSLPHDLLGYYGSKVSLCSCKSNRGGVGFICLL